MKYDVEERDDFLVVRVIGNMTARDKPAVLIDVINNYACEKKINKFLFDLEKVENIDDDGIDVFINCLSLQSRNVEDRDITWAQNLDEKKVEREIQRKMFAQSQDYSENDAEDGVDFPSFEDDLINLGDVYKEDPNAPMTDCFILVKDDDVYDKLYGAGVSGLMTIYRAREDFTRDHGVMLAD
ncbi:MAG: STAS domain-containing protein [Chitinivibrionia bacterium]|nr:STAS domain-containing protein [Chitinivibrionia bacterium]